MMLDNYSIDDFIASELSELETRDIDALFEIICENLTDLCKPRGIEFDQEYVYEELEYQLGLKK